MAEYSLPEKLQEDRVRDLCAFRAASLRYMARETYQKIMDGLKPNEDFWRWWGIAERHKANSAGIEVDPIIRIRHPQFGIMKFTSLRVPQEYHGQAVSITVYVPLRESEAQYEVFRKFVNQETKERGGDITDIYFFDVPFE